MKRLRLWALGLAASLAAVCGLAVAQGTLPVAQSLTSSSYVQVQPTASGTGAGNVYAQFAALKAWINGSDLRHNAIPVLSSCGTSPAIATGSTDVSGRVTTGTGTPTGCVITFAQAFATAPSCVVVSQTAYATSTPSYTVSTTAITITQAAVNSVIYNYNCAAMTGG